jgi:LmeA-like phospholipid-binding
MSTDPTRPMSPPAPAGSGLPEQPEPHEDDQVESDLGQPDPAESTAVPPTRAMPAEPVAPTRVQPAQPTFQPAQPAQPTFHPAQPAQPTPPTQPTQPQLQAGRPDDQAAQLPPQGNWPEQPPRNSPQPGSPGRGGTPGPSPMPRRRRRGRRWVIALFTLIVVLVLLVIGDRVALAVAENDFASQAVSNGMPVKPSVTIEGFPFLTQLIARDFRQVDISASNVPAGPVSITSVKATLTGMHLNSSFSGATVDHISVTAFVSFSSLASAGGGTGISMSADGPGKVKLTADIGGLVSDTEVAKISQTGPGQISVQVLNSGSALGSVLSSFGSFSFSLPKLPASVHITSVSVTSQGLALTAAADHANLSKPSS